AQEPHLLELLEIEQVQQVVDGGLAGDRPEFPEHHRSAPAPASEPTRCTRSVLVDPGSPTGEPATITTYSSGCARPRLSIASSTCRNISSVWRTSGARNASTPQESASWLRTASSGVNASSGSSQCSRASRRTVS